MRDDDTARLLSGLIDKGAHMDMPTTARRPMLYIAGPYTHPDPIMNTHKAARVGTIVWEQTAWVPFVPHLSMLWHVITPRPETHWYALDLAQMAHCDCIVRLPGASTGADHEMAEAERLGLTVVGFADLPGDARDAWLR